MTSRIRKVFNSQEGLTGIVTQLPLDTRFQLENVKVVSAPAHECFSASLRSSQYAIMHAKAHLQAQATSKELPDRSALVVTDLTRESVRLRSSSCSFHWRRWLECRCAGRRTASRGTWSLRRRGCGA